MQFAFNEFRLDLSDDWKQWQGGDANTLSFYSEQRSAGITISVQFYQIPTEKMGNVAQQVIQSRESAHAAQFKNPVVYLQRSIKPHSTGAGLELFYAGEANPEALFYFLGYVTPRKILNLFIETSRCDQDYAASLFSTVLGGYEPKLP